MVISVLTDAQIADAKIQCRYTSGDKHHHEHDDCIRIAYQWLDAQKKLPKPQTGKSVALKHVVESWAGRYVSQSDLDVAAHLHPDVSGKYPHYNLSKRLVKPSQFRLANISEAGKMPNYYGEYGEDTYAYVENDDGEIVKREGV